MVALAVAPSVFAGLFGNGDPRACELAQSNLGPSGGHPFGFDQQGCDLYANVIYGARPSIVIGVTTTLGAAAHRARARHARRLLRRAGSTGWSRALTDVFFGLPFLVGAIVILNTFTERTLWTVTLALVALGWMTMTRVVRACTITVGHQDYVTAARALGANDLRIMRRHVVPNAIAPLIILATLTVGYVIAAEATLTFLGVGLQLPSISWGLLLSRGADELRGPPAPADLPRPLPERDRPELHPARRRRPRRPRPQAAMTQPARRRRTCTSTFPGHVRAVNGLSYTLAAGETVAILGESGSGKSVSALAVMSLLDPPARITERHDPLPRAPCARRSAGREVAMVFQDALTALNPVMPVGRQITESLDLDRKRRRRRAIELLELVRIPDARQPRRRLPARVQRRHAPAGDDRRRARPAPRRPDRRRAHHRARCHRPGQDHAPAPRPPGGARHGPGADHPRPRRGRRAPPTASSSCTPAARSRRRRRERPLRGARAPVHARACWPASPAWRRDEARRWTRSRARPRTRRSCRAAAPSTRAARAPRSAVTSRSRRCATSARHRAACHYA